MTVANAAPFSHSDTAVALNSIQVPFSIILSCVGRDLIPAENDLSLGTVGRKDFDNCE